MINRYSQGLFFLFTQLFIFKDLIQLRIECYNFNVAIRKILVKLTNLYDYSKTNIHELLDNVYDIENEIFYISLILFSTVL